MKKLDFFLAAMAAGEFRRRAWVISAFALTKEAAEAWKSDPYPYRIVQTAVGCLYVNPDNTNELLPIEDVQPGEPPFAIADHVQLKAGQVPNLSQDCETSYGNVLFNYTAVVWPFGAKIPFMLGRVTARQMEELILKRLQDNPVVLADGSAAPRSDKWIYVDEYLKFCDAMFYLAGFTQLCVPGSTPKSLVQPPGMRELRNRLLEENKDRLHDPSVIAQIQSQLIAFDKEYLKGDPAERFLINNKSWSVVRSKMFGMHGAETGLSESVDVRLIPTSLSEGINVKYWDAYNNSLRAGSFNRGASTALGGESVKWLLRASSNITVTEKDCGTKLGIDFTCTDKNYEWLVGTNVQLKNGPQPVSEEDARSYIGSRLVVRSPMYCQLDKTDYCAACVGQRLAAHPTALSTAISEQGSAFLDIFMQAAHGKQLTVAKLDYKTAIQ